MRYTDIVEKAKRIGFVQVNQCDTRPDAFRYRRAVYRAVKLGMLKRVKSKPSAATYRVVSGVRECMAGLE